MRGTPHEAVGLSLGADVTTLLRGTPAAKADIPELANVKHVFVKAAARVNNRAENSH
jgi:putative transposase